MRRAMSMVVAVAALCLAVPGVAAASRAPEPRSAQSDVAVSGTVTQSDGDPAPNVNVVYYDSADGQYEASIATDSFGDYTLHLTPGSTGHLLVESSPVSYTSVTQTSQSYFVAALSPTATYSTDTTVNLTLPPIPPVVTLTVTLLDAEGNPVAGTQINDQTCFPGCLYSDGSWQIGKPAPGDEGLNWSGSESCTTDASGQCTFDGGAGLPAVLAYKVAVPPGYEGGSSDQTSVVQFGATNGATTLTEPPLPATTPVSGTVTQSDGDPAPNVNVVYYDSADGQYEASIATDSFGDYTLHLTPGSTGHLLVESSPVSYTSVTQTSQSYFVAALSPTATYSTDTTVNLTLPPIPPVVTLTVTLLDAEGNPVAGTQINDQTCFPGCLYSDGSWQIGKPAPGDEGLNWSGSESCTTDASGQCTFDGGAGLPAVLAYKVAVPPGYEGGSSDQTSVVQFGATNGATTLTEPPLPATTPVSGTVTQSDGDPAPNVNVVYYDSADGQYEASIATDSFGDYTLHLTPGSTGHLLVESSPVSYTSVTQTSQSYFVAALSPTATYSTDTTVNLTLPPIPPVVTLTVTLLDAEGNPVAGTQINDQTCFPGCLYSDGSWQIGKPAPGDEGLNWSGSESCTTDASGQCTFDGGAGLPAVLAYKVAVPPGYEGGSSDQTSVVQFGATNGATTLTLDNLGSVTLGAATTYLLSPNGTDIESPSAFAVSKDELPPGGVVVASGLRYTLTHVPTGGKVLMQIDLPPGSHPTSLYKLLDGEYVDVTPLASISGATVKLDLTDGALGDEDGKRNGVIVDPIVPIKGVIGKASVIIETRATVMSSGKRKKVTLKVTTVGPSGSLDGRIQIYDGKSLLSSHLLDSTEATYTISLPKDAGSQIDVVWRGSARYRPTCSMPVSV